MGPHSSIIQKNCAFRDTSTKFGTLVEWHIMKRFEHWATTDLASEGCSHRAIKYIYYVHIHIYDFYISGTISLFMWSIWMRLTSWYKVIGLNIQKSNFKGGRNGVFFESLQLPSLYFVTKAVRRHIQRPHKELNYSINVDSIAILISLVAILMSSSRHFCKMAATALRD